MSVRTNNYDAIVVGAGVAGCLFSRDLARAGYSVCLLEQNEWQRVGHHWWDNVKKSVFDEVGLAHPTADELFKRGETWISSPKETVNIKTPANDLFYAINRRKLARRMIDEAVAAGVELRDRTTVSGPVVDPERRCVQGVRIKASDHVLAPLTVDCSGYYGVVRANIPFATDFDKHIRRLDTFITYREIRSKKAGVKDEVMYWKFGKYRGVSWVSFCQDELVDFFAGRVDLPTETITPKQMVRELLERYKGTYTERLVMGGYGALIPVRAAMDSFVENGFMLIGDAACQCSPLNGSGMESSLLGAHLAAATAIEVLGKDSDRIIKETLWPYNVAYHRSDINRTYAFFDVIQKYLVRLTEDEIEYIFKKKIVDLNGFATQQKRDMTMSTGEKLVILFKCLGKFGLLKKLIAAAKNANRMKEIYAQYPTEYSQEAFKKWRAEKNACYPR